MNKFTVIAKKETFWEVIEGKQKRISKARFDEILTQKVVKTEKRENETVYHVAERESIELFSFTELPENVQNVIIEENRYIHVEFDDWFNVVQDNFHETLELLGFSNVKSNFRGFGSQGDGASFIADWDDANIVNNPAAWESPRAYANFKPFMDVLSKLGGKAKIYRVAKRCYITSDNVVAGAVLEELYDDCCSKYYRNLRNEYDYLTSDAALKDYLSCDCLKYTKNGLRVNG